VNYMLQLGYADNVHGCTGNSCFPSIFNGTNGTTAATYFVGSGQNISDAVGGCISTSTCFDSGVILITGKLAPAQGFVTVTQGGWGAPPHGGNPGAFLVKNFSSLGSVVIGKNSCFTLTFDKASAIQDFLPQGGTPGKLAASATDPTTSAAGVFAGQVLALQLNVQFSNLGLLPPGLGGYIVPSVNKSVSQILTDANAALGCGTLPAYVTSISDLNDIVDSINEKFD